jgi:hypothetical protein
VEEKLQRHDRLYFKIASLSKIVASELGIRPMMTMDYYDSNCHSLSEIAASELGLLPAMKIEDDGIYITREDSGEFLILTYSFKRPSDWTKAQLEDLASQILKQQCVDDEFLINNGFTREYGAIASMRKSLPISPPSPPHTK